MPINLGRLTFNEFTPGPNEQLGDCAYCHDKLVGNGLPLVAHKGMGQKHPLHEECIQQLVNANFEFCPSCRATRNPTSWKERFFSKITCLAKPAILAGLGSVTIASLGEGLGYTLGARIYPSVLPAGMLCSAILGSGWEGVRKKILESANSGGKWTAFAMSAAGLGLYRTFQTMVENGSTGHLTAEQLTTSFCDLTMVGLAYWVALIGETALRARKEEH